MANIRIQRPRIRKVLTVLNDCEPPDTCAIASVLPCVGRTEPVDSGIQSIWFLKTAVTFPCCSGLIQMWPSLHLLSSRSSCTFGCECCSSSFTGSPLGSYMRTSQPRRNNILLASYDKSREYELSCQQGLRLGLNSQSVLPIAHATMQDKNPQAVLPATQSLVLDHFQDCTEFQLRYPVAL